MHDSRPRIANADIARFVGPGRDFLAIFVNNRRIDSWHPWACTPRLHGIDGGLGAAEEASVFGLPPGIDNYRLTFAHYIVIPAPDLGLDRLSHCSHVFEVVVVLGGFIVTGLAQHANGCRRGVKDVDIQALGDSPRPPGVGIGGNAFVEDAGGGQRQGTINNIGVARDPSDVGHAPVNIFGMNVLDVLGCAGHVGEVAAGTVLAAFGLSGAAAGVHEKQRLVLLAWQN